jgi:hypothetical protein
VATTTYEAEASTYNQPNNIFKALGGIIYTSALTTAIPAAFTQNTTADLIQLDTTLWSRLGLLSQKDGLMFARSMKQDDESSWGYDEPTRSDISQDIESAVFVMQEINKQTMQMYHMVDLSAVHPDGTTGEVQFNKPQLTIPVYQRMIYMAVDGVGTDRRYKFKVMPRAHVTAVKDEAWQQAGATQFPVTVTATVDPTLGYSVREVLAGPGQKSRNAAANFV